MNNKYIKKAMFKMLKKKKEANNISCEGYLEANFLYLII